MEIFNKILHSYAIYCRKEMVKIFKCYLIPKKVTTLCPRVQFLLANSVYTFIVVFFCTILQVKVGLHSIRFSYVFCTYGKRIRFFLRTYMQTIYAHPFFCCPDENVSVNFTYASSRAWLYFCPLPYVPVG